MLKGYFTHNIISQNFFAGQKIDHIANVFVIQL